VTCRRLLQPEKHAHRGRLARPVRTEQADDRPLGDGERQLVDHGALAVLLDEPFEFDGVIHRHLPEFGLVLCVERARKIRIRRETRSPAVTGARGHPLTRRGDPSPGGARQRGRQPQTGARNRGCMSVNAKGCCAQALPPEGGGGQAPRRPATVRRARSGAVALLVLLPAATPTRVIPPTCSSSDTTRCSTTGVKSSSSSPSSYAVTNSEPPPAAAAAIALAP